MNIQPLKLLRWHAGLEQEGPTDKISIAQITWIPSNQAESINRTTAELLAILGEINHDVNGAKPSESSGKSQVISRQIVFAIEEIRRLLREALTKCKSILDQEALQSSEKKITCAWSGIVAGDIDNLIAYVNEQI